MSEPLEGLKIKFGRMSVRKRATMVEEKIYFNTPKERATIPLENGILLISFLQIVYRQCEFW